MAYNIQTDSKNPDTPHYHTSDLTTLEGRVTDLETALTALTTALENLDTATALSIKNVKALIAKSDSNLTHVVKKYFVK